LEDKELDESPFLTIEDDALEKTVQDQYLSESKSGLKKLKNRAKEFSPSGIVIHPTSGDYYLLSAKGSTVVIINEDKEIQEVIFLDNRIIPQPEGICFGKERDLYISTEGQGFSGKIFKFESR